MIAAASTAGSTPPRAAMAWSSSGWSAAATRVALSGRRLSGISCSSRLPAARCCTCCPVVSAAIAAASCDCCCMRLAAAGAVKAAAASGGGTCSSAAGACAPAPAQLAACAAAALRCCCSASPCSSASAAASSAASGPAVDGGLLPERDRTLCRRCSAGGICTSEERAWVSQQGRQLRKAGWHKQAAHSRHPSSQSARQAGLVPAPAWPCADALLPAQSPVCAGR